MLNDEMEMVGRVDVVGKVLSIGLVGSVVDTVGMGVF